ncbi:MAG: IS1595 family transposase ISMpo2 [Gammaproteobacteria bacterium]|nr:IS1595 family transposase ISMpo2 [Gammaproteobacteria bacterium]
MQKLYRVIPLALALGAAFLPATATAEGALKVDKQVEIAAPPATVWKMIGNYNHLDVWHPAVAASDLTGSGTSAGDVRVLTLRDGATITERLVAYSDAERSYTYAIEGSPLPVDGYVSTLVVLPGEDGGSVVRWSSTFDPKGAPAEKASEVIAGIYDAGLGRLATYFNAK